MGGLSIPQNAKIWFSVREIKKKNDRTSFKIAQIDLRLWIEPEIWPIVEPLRAKVQ